MTIFFMAGPAKFNADRMIICFMAGPARIRHSQFLRSVVISWLRWSFRRLRTAVLFGSTLLVPILRCVFFSVSRYTYSSIYMSEAVRDSPCLDSFTDGTASGAPRAKYHVRIVLCCCCCCCCCLHIKPFFLPNDISSTPSVLPDSLS